MRKTKNKKVYKRVEKRVKSQQQLQTQLSDVTAQLQAAGDVLSEMKEEKKEISPVVSSTPVLSIVDDIVEGRVPPAPEALFGQRFDDHIKAANQRVLVQHPFRWTNFLPSAIAALFGRTKTAICLAVAGALAPTIATALHVVAFDKCEATMLAPVEDISLSLQLQAELGGSVPLCTLGRSMVSLTSRIVRAVGGEEIDSSITFAGRSSLCYTPEDRIFSQRDIKPVLDRVVLDSHISVSQRDARLIVSVPDIVDTVSTKFHRQEESYVVQNVSHTVGRYPQLSIPAWLHSHVHRGNVDRVLFQNRIESHLNSQCDRHSRDVLSAIGFLTACLGIALHSIMWHRFERFRTFTNQHLAWLCRLQLAPP